MRILLVLVLALLTINWSFSSCKSSTPPSFCDTVCLKDSIKFIDETHELKPYVWISAKDCTADTITWSYTDMGNNRKLSIPGLFNSPIKINKDAIDCFIKDTSYAWLSLNDCSNGRGFLLKIPFNKRDKISLKSSAITGHDPKFSVDKSLVAYSDRGNLFVEDKATGKQAMMTFKERVEIDYANIHQFIDSVNITPTRIWANVKIKDDWKVFEKKIELK